MLARSALEHAVSMLARDVDDQPGWDEMGEDWHTQFMPKGSGPENIVNVDGLPGTDGNARWIYVKDENGTIIGRYAILVEDEASKINVNAASALSEDMQSQGVGTFEIMLTDGKKRGLPVPLQFGENILRYRYGRDALPGQARRDDNLTEASYALDEIDNDGDTLLDERGEGIDEPQEYMVDSPQWDDRTFATVQEVCDIAGAGKNLSPAARRLLRKYTTVSSRSRELFWDQSSGTWHKKLNINCGDRNQIDKIMRRANVEVPFTANARSLRNLVVNVIDYRDQNHVLTTVGSDYGVEAVCFNEVMAYEKSMTYNTSWAQPYMNGRPDLRPLTRRELYAEGVKWRLSNVQGNTITLKEPVNVSACFRGNILYAMDTQWEKGFWKNATLSVQSGGATKQFNVVDSMAGNGRTLVLDRDSNLTNNPAEYTAWLNSKWNYGCWFAEGPEASLLWFYPTGIRSGHNEYYYKTYLLRGDIWVPSLTELDIDGDPSRYNPTDEYRRRYAYMDGEPIRGNQFGYIPVLVTSSKKCSSAKTQTINFTYFARPDIVELINVSDRPISLKNWDVVVNTGIEAETLATIDSVLYYSPDFNKRYEDPNPVIKANGYFYLTNNRKVFDYEHGNGDGDYGSDQSERIPVYELPDTRWGITYNVIDSTKQEWNDWFKVDGADWEDDQLKGEIFDIIAQNKDGKEDGAVNNNDGLIFEIDRNTRNTIWAQRTSWLDKQINPGDKVMIFGLPRQGGFVSFTLKNEYDQITARTTTYGSVDDNEIGWSTEKSDPTHYNWVPNRTPTIGGTELEARNKTMISDTRNRTYIKNNNLATVAEIQNVRKAEDWENIGLEKGKQSIRALKALSKYFTVSGIRLDPEELDVHVSGWKPAFGTAVQSAVNRVTVAGSPWETGIWSGQKVTILSGPLSGEEFIATNSTPNTIQIDGYSTVGRKQFRIDKGERFCVGPAYGTPVFYTRQVNEPGEWEWKNKNLEKTPYALYLFGLNDSINTTEFLEENWNAELDVAAFNYGTRLYDALPLDNGNNSGLYRTLTRNGRHTYDKSDGVYCGMLSPDHISPNGGIRLQLIAHNLDNEHCSGFAWFDYAYLSPTSTDGKININTAPERVLSSLKDITPARAKSIAGGIARNGQPGLKPYHEISDILDVSGITPSIYSTICNLITTRSDQYRVTVLAQSLHDANHDGGFNAGNGDTISAEARMDVVVDRGELTDGDAGTSQMRVTQSR